ncbi:unnamed protein product [Peniophora sp. CBMAI 1063]|nr:unnamed protein product [Peniophora sp. CBMAI 1063]
MVVYEGLTMRFSNERAHLWLTYLINHHDFQQGVKSSSAFPGVIICFVPFGMETGAAADSISALGHRHTGINAVTAFWNQSTHIRGILTCLQHHWTTFRRVTIQFWSWCTVLLSGRLHRPHRDAGALWAPLKYPVALPNLQISVYYPVPFGVSRLTLVQAFTMRWGFFKDWILVVCFILWVGTTVGQDPTVPGTWQNSTSSLSREERESLAYSAAVPLSKIDTLGSTGLAQLQDVTSLFALLALQDYYSGNVSWRTQGTDNLQAYIDKYGFFAQGKQALYSDAIYWGLGIFYSYRTYKDPALMALAVSAWETTYTGAFITPSEAVSGQGAGRNVSFLSPTNCTGGTFAGGVFRSKDVQSSTYAGMEAIGPFMALSAYLFEETNNATYQETAQLSLDFVLNHLWNGSIVFDGLELSTCNYLIKPFTINQAWFVEGLSVWANVTKNDTMTTLLQDVVFSVTQFPSWSLPDGVVFDHDPLLNSFDQILKGVYIRGLAEARARNPETALARYIEAYITVQFNSMLSGARGASPNDSFYSVSWYGPAPTSFDTSGNVAALDVLNAAFSLVAPSSSPGNPSTGSTPTSQSATASAKSSKAGPIAGGVVGGVAAVAAVLAIFFFYRRRKAQEHAEAEPEFGILPVTTTFVQPFVTVSSTVNATTTSSKSQRSAPLLSVSSPVSTSPSAPRDQEYEQGESIDVSELPSLVQRLNNFLQGRQSEAPPRYME